VKRDYQKELDRTLARLEDEGKRPSLLLHSCCAPCSSYVIEYLSKYFDIGIYYYNPNIFPESEYLRRLYEQERLIRLIGSGGSTDGPSGGIKLVEGAFEPNRFMLEIAGLEEEPEGGSRCSACIRMRLESTARAASRQDYDYFSTTLSVSPHKNAALINEIGEEMGEKHRAAYLVSDFKKKDGYRRSVELSKLYRLYRQDFCGCIWSKSNRKSGKK
jgi:predicted adenine nucleotide alpha hydrolase (AANH) superfamily ATPase